MSDVVDRLDRALEGRYRIQEELGQGGMATVYLAEDLKHRRRVAMKVLRPELAAVVGAERFLAEIETTANLQHPHILPLFDSGEADGFLFYVMPYVEGESLRERLDRERQLPVDQALEIAAKVASALHYAHEEGVVHRDVKPANILLSRGEPLVADFGIALALSEAGGGRITETGLSLGTPHYMSPEQASGERSVDRRSDVYSLACVLWEMLAGEPPYAAPTAQAVLARILTERPRRITDLRRTVPRHVAAAVDRGLEKLPADRFPTVEAFRRALEDPTFRHDEEGGAAVRGPAAPARDGPSGGRFGVSAPVIALGALAMVLGILAAWGWLRSPPEARPIRLGLDLGLPNVEDVDPVVVSPDGTLFAVAAVVDGEPALYLRRVDESRFRKIPGTEHGRWPSFSPDGRWIAYRDTEEEALMKISVSGGGPLTLVSGDGPQPYDPHWGTDQTILFTGPDGLHRIPATGTDEPEFLNAELAGRRPRLLPDGGRLLITPLGQTSVHLYETATDSSRVIVAEGSHASYVQTGHIVYAHPNGGLFAVPFDLESGTVTGSPAPVLDRVATVDDAAAYSVSREGTLVYREGAVGAALSGDRRRLLLLDRTGRGDTLRLSARDIDGAALSPDGRLVAFDGSPAGGGPEQIHTFDVRTGTTTQVTFEGAGSQPEWSPDGTRLAFASFRQGADGADLFVKPLSGDSLAEKLAGLPGDQIPTTWWSADSLGFMWERDEGWDLFTMSLSGDSEPIPYLQAEWDEMSLKVSPDGTLAAYQSDETGRYEIYLRRFPEPAGQWRVSRSGGEVPRWSPDGSEVYFWSLGEPDSLFAARVRTEPTIRVEEPELLFAGPFRTGSSDPHPDGRFLVTLDLPDPAAAADGEASEDERPRDLVVLNWFTELRERLGEAARR